MKQGVIFLFAAVLVFAATVTLRAQDVVDERDPVHEGAWKVGGEVGFDMYGGDAYENGAGDGRTVITISPQAMYFIIDKLGIGARVMFQSSSQGDFTNSALSVGPEIAYYFAMYNSRLYPFVGAGVFFGSNTSTSETTVNGTTVTTESTSSSSVILLSGGLMIELNPYVGVHGSLNYEMHSFSRESNNVTISQDGNVFGIRFGFDVFLH